MRLRKTTIVKSLRAKDMDDQELPLLELSAFVGSQTTVQQAHLMSSTEDPELEI